MKSKGSNSAKEIVAVTNFGCDRFPCMQAVILVNREEEPKKARIENPDNLYGHDINNI
jgi:hypothetical protein